MKYVVTLAGQEVEVEVDGERVVTGGRSYVAQLHQVDGSPIRQLFIDGRSEVLALQAEPGGRWALTRRGDRFEIEVIDERTRHIRGLAGGAERQRGLTVLKAPMPGLVVRVQVEAGQPVAVGSGVIVLEAMKMENELRAGAAAVVRLVRVRPGDAVEKGQVLVEFEGDS